MYKIRFIDFKRIIPTFEKLSGFKQYQTSTRLLQQSEPVCPAHDFAKKDKDEWSVKCHVDKTTWENAKPFDEIPGLRDIPIIGNTWRFLPGGKYYNLQPIELLRRFYQEYGEIVRLEGIIGMKNMVYLFNADDIETVYKQESVMPEREIFPSITHFREKYRQDLFKDFTGLVTSNGQAWYVFRNKVNKIMMQPKVVKHYISPIDIIAKDFVQRIKKIRNNDGAVDDEILKEAKKWALESTAYLALDERLGCLDDNHPVDSIPSRMIQNAEDAFAISELLDMRPSIWRYYATPTYKKAMKLFDESVGLMQDEIMKAMEVIKTRKMSHEPSDNREKSVLEKLMDVDPKIAIIMCIDMMLAGIDTTSNTLVNILYHLSCNPMAQQKLRDEINSVIPNITCEITGENLSNMPYLKGCIKEANRIYPVTLGTVRDLTKDTVLHGYQIPKGKTILLIHYHTSNSEKQFPKPTEFIPDRWLRENQDSELSYKNAHPFSTMPFGFGARSCVGRRFAELELEIALINIIRSFNILWRGDPPTRITVSLNYLRAPFGFIFKDI